MSDPSSPQHKARIASIQKYETTLDDGNDLFTRFETILEELHTYHPRLAALMQYYHSEKWMKDMEDSGTGVFDDIPHGVLSQDAVYDLYTRQRDAVIRAMNIALRYIETP